MFMLRGHGLADSQESLTSLKERFAMNRVAIAHSFQIAPVPDLPAAGTVLDVLAPGSTKPWYTTWWGLSAIVLGLYGGYRFLLK